MRLQCERRVAALAQLRVVDPANPVLSRDDEHHLRDVLRARVGEEIVVTDGEGRWSICEVRDSSLRVLVGPEHDERGEEITLYLAPLKGDRSEWAVAKATELGISRVVPLVSERLSVKFRGETRDKIVARWRRIGAEAAGQCRRTYDIVIDDPVAVADVPAEVAVCDMGGGGDWRAVRSVAIGPEGGFAPTEWGSARRVLALGPTVLRAETAAICAATVLAFSAGGWGFTVDPGELR